MIDLNQLIEQKQRIRKERAEERQREHDEIVEREFQLTVQSVESSPASEYRIRFKENIKPLRDLGLRVKRANFIARVFIYGGARWWVSVPDRK